ncbi:hypothetical protein DE4585_02161 [Mycobacteroides salmoniphilum]|uniref:Uncharacterized protein n=1 Tax=Mycobacteroides salmoniphilum TaxID=404941 RepID=A0A4R8S2C2_9MYCO|nr:hypothetical protein [Mycobacteroides salmoniphilum]TDZ75781.1 hypothetical protein DE4586_03674 [Mycobacteroides salmoniphilum]TDZ83366.1 hypothetical protein DE4585_02161 [Mycobacteroides salmoniphilum]TDZ84299.1 hypothetical protein DE4587_03215 [Mycobacteroides salmoniphilum]
MIVSLLIAVGCFLLLLVVLRARRRRTPEAAAPTPRAKRSTDDELRKQLLTRLARDMRAPTATAVRAVAALRDAAVSAPSPTPVPIHHEDPDELSWAPL